MTEREGNAGGRAMQTERRRQTAMSTRRRPGGAPARPESDQQPGGTRGDERLLLDPSTDAGEVEESSARQLTQAQLVVLRYRRHRMAMIGLVVLALILVVTLLAPMIVPENPYDPMSFDPANSNIAPTLHPWKWVLGTDVNGHSILSQILWGGRISLAVGIISAAAVSLLGFAVGATAGYFGGTVDTLVMRVTDVFLTLPFLPILLVVSSFFGQGNVALII